MPATILTIEEFSLATLDGQDVGTVAEVSFQITYWRNGEWEIDGVGFPLDGARRKPSWNEVAFFQKSTPLEDIIIKRACDRYGDRIQSHIDTEIEWDGDAPDLREVA